MGGKKKKEAYTLFVSLCIRILTSLATEINDTHQRGHFFLLDDLLLALSDLFPGQKIQSVDFFQLPRTCKILFSNTEALLVLEAEKE